MLFFIISVLAGVLTVLAPCTLPLLPVIVGGSLDGGVNRKKALVIVASLGLSIILFTFALKYSSAFISIPESTWMYISGGIIIIFGLSTLVPAIWESLPLVSEFSQKSNSLMSVGFQKKNFWGDVIIGASLGPVFSTCSPTYFVILATVLPRSFAEGTVDLLGYTGGLALMLLLIAFAGQKIVNHLGGLTDPKGWFKKILGLIFILLGVAIIFGVDKKVEAKILSSGFFDVTTVEQKLLSHTQTTESQIGTATTTLTVATSTDGFHAPVSHGPLAPEFVNPTGYINTGGQPITLSQYRGKVVLLDIWTYSCINCQRTLPYVKEWYAKYKDQGLVVIGIHTPEFSFEKVQSNVEDAVKRFGITYPVIMDNNYETWNAYGNQYWPRKYLINARGEIIYDHIGEGGYDETEKQIQNALAELNNKPMNESITQPDGVITVDPTKVASPETYFGSNRNEYLANGRQGVSGVQTLLLPEKIQPNLLYLEGTWNFSSEYARTTGPAKIVFTYNAKNVYMVASSDDDVNVTVLKDGKEEKKVSIKGNALYPMIEGASYGTHTMEIDIPPGSSLDAFTFTFG